MDASSVTINVSDKTKETMTDGPQDDRNLTQTPDDTLPSSCHPTTQSPPAPHVATPTIVPFTSAYATMSSIPSLSANINMIPLQYPAFVTQTVKPLAMCITPMWQLTDAETFDLVFGLIKTHNTLPVQYSFTELTAIAWWQSRLVAKLSQSNFHLRACRILEEGKIIAPDVARQIMARMLIHNHVQSSTTARDNNHRKHHDKSLRSSKKRKRHHSAVEDNITPDDNVVLSPVTKKKCPLSTTTTTITACPSENSVTPNR